MKEWVKQSTETFLENLDLIGSILSLSHALHSQLLFFIILEILLEELYQCYLHLRSVFLSLSTIFSEHYF